MVYVLSESATINGDVSSIWQTMTDVASWATWDPHFLNCGFEGPFEVGAKGWTINRIVSGGASHFTLVSVENERSFTTQSPMPFGKMLIVNEYRPAGEGRVTVSRRSEIHGAFGPVFRLYAKRYRTDVQLTFAALEKEARRRAMEGETAR